MNYSSFAKCVRNDIKKQGKPVSIEEREVLRNFPQNKSYRSILKNLRYSYGLHGVIRIKNFTRYIVFSIVEKKKRVDNSNYMYEESLGEKKDNPSQVAIKILNSVIEDLVKENLQYKKRARQTSMYINFIAGLAVAGLFGLLIVSRM